MSETIIILLLAVLICISIYLFLKNSKLNTSLINKNNELEISKINLDNEIKKYELEFEFLKNSNEKEIIEREGSKWKSDKRWLVRGHLRNQFYKSSGGYKLIFMLYYLLKIGL